MRSLTKNRKLFWKEVKEERGVRDVNVRIKGEDGVCVSGKGEVKEVWKSHFERSMNEKTE